MAVVILAAGQSRRLGRPKQLVRHRGMTLIRRAARLALALQPLWVGVVVGARAGRMAAELAGLPVRVVRNREWRRGQSSSLQAALRAAPRSARWLLVLAVDQWALETSDLRELVSNASRDPVACRHGTSPGIPALLPRGWWPSLRALRGDQGARQQLATSRVRVIALPRALIDLDQPADLSRLRRSRRP